MVVHLTTWNLQGRAGPDLDVVADHLVAVGADVAALQEVTRSQARRLARRLGWSVAWRFKHWSVVVPPEGLAVLSPHPIRRAATVHLAHRWRPWSWRRRITVAAVVEVPDGPLAVASVHLGAGVGDPERVRQARLAAAPLAAADVTGGVLAGDLNTHPGSAVLEALAALGLRDAWAEARPGEPGPTNWRPGPRDGPPTQRLDYVLVPGALTVTSASVPDAGDDGFDRFAATSDHLPVTVAVEPR